MKNLYIIGNGFDLAHELPTSYDDFHDYLKGTSYFQENNDNDDTLFVSKMEEIFGYTENNINLWSDFENALGDLNVGEYIESLAEEYGEENPGRLTEQVYARLEYIETKMALDVVQEKFAKWVREIEVYDDIVPCFSIDPDALFFTFNYTNTLEKVYKIDPNQVLHIHGSASQIDSEIIVGHRTNYNPRDYEKMEEKLFGVDADIFPLITRVMNGLQKNTRNIINDNQQWFSNLAKQQITDIYLYGLSFGKIDDDYYKEILKKLPDVKWHFAVYTGDKGSIGRISSFIKRIKVSRNNCSAFNQDTGLNIALP